MEDRRDLRHLYLIPARIHQMVEPQEHLVVLELLLFLYANQEIELKYLISPCGVCHSLPLKFIPTFTASPTW